MSALNNLEKNYSKEDLQHQFEGMQKQIDVKDLSEKDKQAILAINKKIADIKTEVVDAEQAQEISTEIETYQKKFLEEKNNVTVLDDGNINSIDDKNPIQGGDDRLDSIRDKTARMLSLTQDVAKEGELLMLHTELKILKEILDYININNAALWNEIVLKNRGNNAADAMDVFDGTKKRARRVLSGESQVDQSDMKYTDIKNHPKLLNLTARLKSLNKEYDKLTKINALVPCVIARTKAIEIALKNEKKFPELAYQLNKRAKFEEQKKILDKVYTPDGKLDEQLVNYMEEANIAAKSAKSENAIVHVYNDLHGKISNKVAEWGILDKKDAGSLVNFLAIIGAAVYAPTLWKALPGGFLAKVTAVGGARYFGGKALNKNSQKMIKGYEKNINANNVIDAGTEGENYYKLAQGESFRLGKTVLDTLGDRMVDRNNTNFVKTYMPTGVLDVKKMVADYVNDGPMSTYLKEDDQSIAFMAHLSKMIDAGLAVKIGTATKEYLEKIGITGQALSLQDIVDIHAAYVDNAKKVYHDLQKIGVYQITALGAEKTKEIQQILSSNHTAQDKIDKLIQQGYIFGGIEAQRTQDDFIKEIDDIVTSPTSGIYGTVNKLNEETYLATFKTAISSARSVVQKAFGGSDQGLTLRAKSANGEPSMFIQSFGRKTEFMIDNNGQYVLPIFNEGLVNGSPEKVILAATVYNWAWTMIGALGEEPWTVTGGKLNIKSGLLDSVKGWFGVSASDELNRINKIIEYINNGNPQFVHNIAKNLNKQTMTWTDAEGKQPKDADGNPAPVSMFSKHSLTPDPYYIAIGKNGETEQSSTIGRDMVGHFDNANQKRVTQKIGDMGATVLQAGLDMVTPSAELAYSTVKSVTKVALDDGKDGLKYMLDAGGEVVVYAFDGITAGTRKFLEQNIPWVVNMSMNTAGMLVHGLIDLGDQGLRDVGGKMQEYLAIINANDQLKNDIKESFNGIIDFTVEGVTKVGTSIIAMIGQGFQQAGISIDKMGTWDKVAMGVVGLLIAKKFF